MIINLHWKGPHSFREVQEMTGTTDYGLYQVYGHHPVYGPNTLLYIGMAWERTFGGRFSPHEKFEEPADQPWGDNGLRYYVHTGRIHLKEGESRPRNDTLGKRVAMAEHLLIATHAPSWNSKYVTKPPDTPDYYDFHVLNWGQYERLLPEVSGLRFTNDATFNRLADEPVALA